MATKRRARIGRLLVIGGGEQRDAEGEILRHWVELAGGARARIVICAASLDDPAETMAEYKRVFSRLGAAEVFTDPFPDRKAGESTRLLKALAQATGVFFPGGDQLQVTSRVAGTTFGENLVERWRGGGLVIGGTSAGAAMMSGTMIIGGANDGSVRRSDVQLAPGLGLWRDSVVDTHFNQRGRINRLMTVFSENPQVLGIGLDEDTAVDVQPGVSFDVLGSGVATVMDGRVTHTNASDVGDHGMLALLDSKLHVLPSGYGFDLRTKRPIIPGERRKARSA